MLLNNPNDIYSERQYNPSYMLVRPLDDKLGLAYTGLMRHQVPWELLESRVMYHVDRRSLEWS